MSSGKDEIAARVNLVNGNFSLPEETIAAMRKIRELIATCSQELAACTSSVPYNEARLLAALDALQAVKNVACDAIILPHHDKPK